MVNELNYTSIKRVLEDLLDHPMLKDLTMERVIRYTVRFIEINGYPSLYEDKIANVDIQQFRGVLPCDLINIIQVKDLKSDVCMRAMTDSFTPALLPSPPTPPKDLLNNVVNTDEPYNTSKVLQHYEEPTFKTQGRVIFTSFPEGAVQIAYRAIPLDEDGFPLIADNECFLDALEAYIKKAIFTIKFDSGDIAAGVLQNAKQDYAVAIARLQTEMRTPSPSELEAYTRYYNTLLKSTRHFNNGFKNLGDTEYLRKR